MKTLNTLFKTLVKDPLPCGDPVPSVQANELLEEGPSYPSSSAPGTNISIKCIAGYVWTDYYAIHFLICNSSGSWFRNASSCAGILL